MLNKEDIGVVTEDLQAALNIHLEQTKVDKTDPINDGDESRCSKTIMMRSCLGLTGGNGTFI